MTLNILQAALAGIAGAAIMAIFIYIFKAAGFNLDIPWLLGTRFVPIEKRSKAYTVGIILHLLLGAFWSIFYVFSLIAMAVIPNWPAGIMYGVSHAIFIGAMIGILASEHPHIGEGKAMSDPGMFGHLWGVGVSVELLVVHVIYGASTLWIYHNLM
ncbi:hypothetical protein NC796_00525 [Aliifodinibius sp. S!AR15-10]|uniref:hypothetical protein n=1 Tax=Aliifodinibius sp. S!AR15-10 TaxID=2950437 RepID=UPI00285A56AC|nr:hypothetical protein [Aliifodinibius sp. S!AR15-10]MDR8389598.1 hypothetical protein [Aliifodinibius sp. S!AR15-10]